MKLKIDSFVLSIIVVILIAYFFPFFATDKSPISLDIIGSIGISLIFFFYGLKISPEKIKNGLRNWRLHLFVQLSTFLLFPMIILLIRPLIQTDAANDWWLGFMFLAALPSTVSSSVVMVSLAKGNIPGAIFNASISGLIGIVITPLWMGMFIQGSQVDFDMGAIYIKLLLEILLPVVLGISMQKYWGEFAKTYQRQLTLFDKSVILLIIYKSFGHSFEAKVFESIDVLIILIIFMLTFILFYLIFFVTGLIAKSLNFSKEDQITAQFCGTKKSLVHGTVFSKILFPASFPIGILLLPLMIFHAIQIFIISIIATRMARENGTQNNK